MLPLGHALRWIVDWYRAFQKGTDVRCITESQIARYEELSQN
jgi:hypothetical protein